MTPQELVERLDTLAVNANAKAAEERRAGYSDSRLRAVEWSAAGTAYGIARELARTVTEDDR